MKVIVLFSGGKDSQAALIWAANKYGAKNVTAVFADTGWEHECTYAHVTEVTSSMSVELVTVKNEAVDGMVGLAKKKKRFPSTKAQFCTEWLKIRPVIDWILTQTESMLFVEGIRAQESTARAAKSQECRYFKYYFEDRPNNKKRQTYRGKSVRQWCNQYDDSLIRPFFRASAQDVIDYIIANGQQPNPLYRQGFSRVGCLPCINARKSEVKQMTIFQPEYVDRLIAMEEEVNSSFFPPDYIPKWAHDKVSLDGKTYASARAVVKYVTREQTLDMFDEVAPRACMSFYNICE